METNTRLEGNKNCSQRLAGEVLIIKVVALAIPSYAVQYFDLTKKNNAVY